MNRLAMENKETWEGKCPTCGSESTDYRALLKEYMADVLYQEGITFVDKSNASKELLEIAAEVEAERDLGK